MTARQLSLGGVNGGGVDSVISVVSRSGSIVTAIEPAATFTNATPSSAAGGADTLLTSAGVHGLTSAVAVGVSIYVSGGTGWTVGFHVITAIAVDTTGTTIQLDTPFDAGMGVPTIALANTEITLASFTVEANSMGPTGILIVDPTFSSNDTSATSKIWRLRFGGTQFYGVTVTTSPATHPAPISIHNRGAANTQVNSFSITAASHSGSVASAPATGTVDTTSDVTVLLTAQPAAANIVVRLERYWAFLLPGV